MPNTPEQSKALRYLKRFYLFSVFALMLRFLVLMVFFNEPYHTPVWILAWQVLTAGTGVLLGRMWKKPSFLLMAAYLLLLFCRVFFDDPSHLLDPDLGDAVGPSVAEVLFQGLWVSGACLSLGHVLDRDGQRRFLRGLAAGWTIGMMAHTLIGLYAAWNGIVIWNPVHGSFWGLGTTYGVGGAGFKELNAVGHGEGVRLALIHHCTVSAAILSFSAMTALIAALCEKKWYVKVLYLLALVIYAFAMGLTDTRACHISFASGVGTVSGILLLRALAKKYRKKHPDSRMKKGRLLAHWALALVVAAIVMIAFVFIIGGTVKVFNRLQSADGMIIPSASAEKTTEETDRTPVVVVPRGYAGDPYKVLTGRLEIWESVMRYIKHHPSVLLKGESIWLPMRGVNTQGDGSEAAGHPHCAPMYILLESGIPGLLLIAAVLFLALVRSVKTVNDRESPLWLALLPAVVVSLCVGDLVECICGFLGFAYPNCSALFLCLGVILSHKPANTKTSVITDASPAA